MKVAYKVWIDNHGKAFGDGPHELLRRVEKTNSLHQAALQMGMSYSKAWRLISMVERRLGFRLIERKVGGFAGGGSTVTPKAKRFMKQYDRFHKDIKKTMVKVFQRHFGKSS